MITLHNWIYTHAPAWSAERWAYAGLVLSLLGVLYRFFGQRLKPRLGSAGNLIDKGALAIDFAEAEVRNLRNRARAGEQPR